MATTWRQRFRVAADVLVPVAVSTLGLMGVIASASPAAVTLLGCLAAVIGGVVLWWRRSRPAPVFVTALACGVVLQLIAPDQLFPYAALFALGSLSAALPPQLSLPALLAVVGVTALSFGPVKAGDVAFAMVVAVVPWALGEAKRNRRQAVAEGARLAVSEEQARIARELHDVLAHSITVIVVQAAAGDDVFDEHPDQARAALRSIESSARGALGELRSVLTAVGSQQVPWLDRLGDLAEPLKAAGLTVGLRTEGSAALLPADLDLSAYRIVQEALTNTLRHAGATHADVTVRTDHDLLQVEVVDNGVGSATEVRGAGRGLAGMRERVALLGGSLEAGPLPAGGFRVSARMPVRGRR